MNNTFEKSILRGDLIVDMGAPIKRRYSGSRFRGSTKFSKSFMAGYRAYVFGGRDILYNGRGGVVKARGGLEPYEHLTDEQKREWRDGIEYARKEREECRALMVEETREKLKSPAFYAAAKKQLRELMKRKSFTRKGAAKALGVSDTWVCTQVRALELNKVTK